MLPTVAKFPKNVLQLLTYCFVLKLLLLIKTFLEFHNINTIFIHCDPQFVSFHSWFIQNCNSERSLQKIIVRSYMIEYHVFRSAVS